jgi:hypothetical protein
MPTAQFLVGSDGEGVPKDHRQVVKSSQRSFMLFGFIVISVVLLDRTFGDDLNVRQCTSS